MSTMIHERPTVWSNHAQLLLTPTAPASPVACPPLDTWSALRRYLTIGGVDRAPAQSLPVTVDDADAVRSALTEDSLRVVAEILAATMARPSRREPMLLALALASAADDDLTRRAALTALPRVAWTSRDLFLFATFVQGLRGWGRGLRRAVGAWYNDRSAADLVEDVLTTPAFAGWRHADLLRLGHPKASTPTHDVIYRWLVTGATSGVAQPDPANPDAASTVARLSAVSQLADLTDADRAAGLIGDHRLPLGAVPGALRRQPTVWAALLPHLPLAELLPVLPELAAIGCLSMDGPLRASILARLGDGNAIERERTAPLAVVAAQGSYEAGHAAGDRWTVDESVIRVLEKAFDQTCRHVVAADQPVRLMIPAGLNRSSDSCGPLSMMDVAATLAIVLTSSGNDARIEVAGTRTLPLGVGAGQTIGDVLATIDRLSAIAGVPVDPHAAITITTGTASHPGKTVRLIPADTESADPLDGSVPAHRIAIQGIDMNLVGTVFGLLRS